MSTSYECVREGEQVGDNDDAVSVYINGDKIAVVATMGLADRMVKAITKPTRDKRAKPRAALADLMEQLEGVGIAIPESNEGQWKGAEGLDFGRARRALGCPLAAEPYRAPGAPAPFDC